MFGSMQTGVGAYAKVGMETGVVAANPHQLISMLFEGALVAVANAARHARANEVAPRGQSLSKAIAIIDSGLRASLNKEAGGSIAESLDALYQYMSQRLLEANLQNDAGKMEEVSNLLRDLKQSWDAIGKQSGTYQAQAPAAGSEAPAPAIDPLAPRGPQLAQA